MEKLIEELPLEAFPSQFWGAVKIYTEKPHIINRRICGTVNLWIGVSYENFSRENMCRSLGVVLSHDFDIEEDKNLQTQAASSTDKSKCDYDVKNVETIFSTCSKMELAQIEGIKNILCKCGFKNMQDIGASDWNENVSPCETRGNEEDECKQCGEFQLPSNKTLKTSHLGIPWEHLLDTKTLKIAVIRRVLPKHLKKFIPLIEVVLIDRDGESVSYLAGSGGSGPSVVPRTNYSFTFTTHGIRLSFFEDDGSTSPEVRAGVVWVQKNILPKLIKWTAEVLEDGKVEDRGSLKLVNIQEYNQLYQQLKMKYGKPLVKMWPETTDPLKHVYEDIAIATYLILIWQQERKKKQLTSYQTFVDLGCGNGLLVYILSSEGHQGLGIDIKKRHIWDTFPKHIQLKEGAIEPSDKNLFPEFDWLIGNHSDELTPWIPVIAAKSKHTTRFFVIPCCAHDFDCRYRRKYAGRSQYSDYLEYIKEVGIVCGFDVWQDKLRIPSTKRICLIGQERTYRTRDAPQIFKNINDFIRKRSDGDSKNTENQESHANVKSQIKNHHDIFWTANFKVREAVQPVRNCTQLETSVREDLVLTVAKMLMEKKHVVEVEISQNNFVTWDRGGRMTLSDIAKRMEPQQLLALKKECGGLQTLLKNHKHIFNILHGEANLQIPIPIWKAKVPSSRIKTKPCWFYVSHIMGCPLPSQTCIYAHGDADLKEVNGTIISK